MLRRLKAFVLILSALIIIACAATPAHESTGQYLDSTAITAKVKSNLIESLGTSGFSIQVKTFKDEVQLSGFVNNVRLKQRAGMIASKVQGVKHVRNDLIVK